MTAIVINIAGNYDGRDINKATRALQRLGDAANNNAFVTVGEQLQSVGTRIRQTGERLTLGVTLPLVGIGIAAMNTQAQYETTMNQLAVATDAPVSAMDQLRELAKQLGAETVFSANDAAEAMLELAKGGFTPAQIAGGGVQATMALAATEGLALADAAIITSNAMNTFGIKAKNAAKIADALAGGSIASSASVEGLAQALSQVGPGASNAGLSLSQTVGVLAAFADSGVKGSDAGTSLKTMLARLVPSTKEAADEMRRLGLNFVDAKGNILPITQVAQQLQEKLGGMSEAQRIATLQTIFGSDASRAATILMNEGEAGLRKYIAATQDQGAAQEMANARMDGTAGAMEKMRGTIETALLAIGEALAPIVVQVSGFVREWVDRFQELDPSVQKVIVIVGLLAAAIGPVLIVMGLMVSAIGTIVAALGAVSAPVLAAIAVIGLIVAAVVLLWNKSEAFREAVISVWNQVKAAIVAAINSIKQKLDENREKLDKLKEWMGKVWGFVQEYVFPIIAKFVSDYLSRLVTAIGFVIGKIIDIVGYFVDFVDGVGEMIASVGEFLTEVRGKFGQALTFIGGIPEKVKGFFANAGQWLLDAGAAIVSGLWSGVQGAWDSFVGWIEEKINALPEAVKTVLGINSPSKVFAEIGKSIPEGMVKGVDGYRTRVTAAVERMGRDAGAKAQEALADALGRLDAAMDRKQTRLDKLTAFFERARDIITNAFTQLKDKAAARIDDISAKLTGLRDAAKGYAASISSSLAVAFEVPGIDDAQAKVVKAQDAMTASVEEFGRESDEAKRAVKALADAEKELARVKDGGGVLDRFRQGITDASAFVGQIKQLREFGLNETSLQNIISAGVERGRQIADSLLAEGPGGVGEVNSLYAMFNDQIKSLGNLMAEDKFGEQIRQAEEALAVAQTAYAAIQAREAEQLASLEALGRQFGIETDAMTAILDGGAERIEALLAGEDTATSLLAEAVSEVTTGLLATAAQMAAQAAELRREMAQLQGRIAAAAVAAAAVAVVSRPANERIRGRASGGPVEAGTPYFVGEEGIELFVPRTSGAIVPNHALPRGSGGNTVTVESGAVQVVVHGGSRADVQAAVDEALAGLVRELEAI